MSKKDGDFQKINETSELISGENPNPDEGAVIEKLYDPAYNNETQQTNLHKAYSRELSAPIGIIIAVLLGICIWMAIFFYKP